MILSNLMDAADANMVTHAGWIQQRIVGMKIVESPELVLIDSGLASDTFNLVCRARMERERALERAPEVIEYFRGAGRLFTWWVGPADRPADLGDILSAARLERVESEVAMAADLSRLPSIAELPGFRIERVRTAAQLADFAGVIGGTQDTPDPDVLRFYELAAPLLLTEEAPLWFYVGYLDNLPVATAEVTVAGGVAGLYNISTLPPYRRRGFGTAMTVRPLVEAREARSETAVLQASSEGVGLYSRVGFQAYGKITEYKLPQL
jgi:ribosomal protein S18 acetylase RimI-like enzyme